MGGEVANFVGELGKPPDPVPFWRTSGIGSMETKKEEVIISGIFWDNESFSFAKKE